MQPPPAQDAPPATPDAGIPPIVSWPDQIVLGNSVRAWIVAGSITLGVLVLFYVLRPAAAKVIERVSKRTRTKFDDVALECVRKLRSWWAIIIALYAGMQVLALPLWIDRGAKYAAVAATAVQLFILLRVVVDFGLEQAISHRRTEKGEPDPSVKGSLGVLRFLVLLVMGIGVLLLALDNMDVEVTPLLTGLGVGGIAIALAVQNILSDIFSSLTIVLDKPFVVGDFIVVGDKNGTVERIGVKTTRVRALSGEELVFANSDLLGSRVQNFRRMRERRVVTTFGVTYETPREKLVLIPGVIREAIARRDGTRIDRCHLKALSSYSIDFELVYFVLTPDYNTFMDIHQALLLDVMEKFSAQGVSFAYPTSVQYMADLSPDAATAHRPHTKK
ncbi:MAG TPA: mechanosensitive ion channel family protein [Phycisphaerales bacterium]|nr:mechanosensitive ion channel family protein [Phycisphaerales bacterium]